MDSNHYRRDFLPSPLDYRKLRSFVFLFVVLFRARYVGVLLAYLDNITVILVSSAA